MPTKTESRADLAERLGSRPLRLLAGAVVLRAIFEFVHGQLATHLHHSMSIEGLDTTEGLVLGRLITVLVVGVLCIGAGLGWLRQLRERPGRSLERTLLVLAVGLFLLTTAGDLGIAAVDWIIATHDYSFELDYAFYGLLRAGFTVASVHCRWVALAIILVASRSPRALAYGYPALCLGLTLHALFADPRTPAVPAALLMALGYGTTVLWLIGAWLASRRMDTERGLGPASVETSIAVSGLKTIRFALWLQFGSTLVGSVGLQILLARGLLDRADLMLTSWLMFAVGFGLTAAFIRGLNDIGSLAAFGVSTDGFQTTTRMLIVAVCSSFLAVLVAYLASRATSHDTVKIMLSAASWATRLSLAAGLVGSLTFWSNLEDVAVWAEDSRGQGRAVAMFWLTLAGGAVGAVVLAYVALGDPEPGALIVQIFAMLAAAGFMVVFGAHALWGVARTVGSRHPEASA